MNTKQNVQHQQSKRTALTYLFCCRFEEDLITHCKLFIVNKLTHIAYRSRDSFHQVLSLAELQRNILFEKPLNIG